MAKKLTTDNSSIKLQKWYCICKQVGEWVNQLVLYDGIKLPLSKLKTRKFTFIYLFSTFSEKPYVLPIYMINFVFLWCMWIIYCYIGPRGGQFKNTAFN